MEPELAIQDIPLCGGDENGCELINNFLNYENDVIKGYESFKIKEQETKYEISKKEEYLELLRKEQEKVIIEIYILKNNSYNGKKTE